MSGVDDSVVIGERAMELSSKRDKILFPPVLLVLLRVTLVAVLFCGPVAAGTRGAVPEAMSRQAGQAARTPDWVARSQWWDEVEAADALIRDGKWRKAHRLVEQTLGLTLRQGWQEPDLGRVLAAQCLQRAVLALHRGETGTALWSWDEARALDPSVEERLEAYGELVEPLRRHPRRRQGHLPDGTEPPPRFATPGYEPFRVAELPPAGEIENAWFHQLPTLPKVTVEVVVGADGALRDPVVEGDRNPPVLVLWTLERIRGAGLEIRPARLDGEPIDDLTTIEMDFSRSRW